MSTIAIIGIVSGGLFVLVAIAVAKQSIEKNNKIKRRLHSGLTARARNFEYMLAGFPDGFLNRDLQMLVCKCLLQVYEQLMQLEPEVQKHASRTKDINQKLKSLKNKPTNQQSTTLTDTKQIKEVQKLLNGLFKFISQLTDSKKISAKEGMAYAKQIRYLKTQSSVDALAQAKMQALAENKNRLAIHYLKMSIAQMNKENDAGFFNSQISKHQEQINALTQQEQTTKESSAKAQKKKSAEEWEDINKDNDTWKKKAIYD